MSANTKIVVLRRKELLYTGIFAALGVLFVILLLMLLLPGKAADTSGAPDSPDSTAETVMPDNVADLGRIPQSAQTEDVSTGAVADTDAVLDNASGPVGTDNTYIPGIYTTELILGSETVNVEVIVNDHAITSLSPVYLHLQDFLVLHRKRFQYFLKFRNRLHADGIDRNAHMRIFPIQGL